MIAAILATVLMAVEGETKPGPSGQAAAGQSAITPEMSTHAG